jgi:hypothetical protein
MSMKLQNPDYTPSNPSLPHPRPHNLHDDLESFLWVTIWTLVALDCATGQRRATKEGADFLEDSNLSDTKSRLAKES